MWIDLPSILGPARAKCSVDGKVCCYRSHGHAVGRAAVVDHIGLNVTVARVK